MYGRTCSALRLVFIRSYLTQRARKCPLHLLSEITLQNGVWLTLAPTSEPRYLPDGGPRILTSAFSSAVLVSCSHPFVSKRKIPRGVVAQWKLSVIRAAAHSIAADCAGQIGKCRKANGYSQPIAHFCQRHFYDQQSNTVRSLLLGGACVLPDLPLPFLF